MTSFSHTATLAQWGCCGVRRSAASSLGSSFSTDTLGKISLCAHFTWNNVPLFRLNGENKSRHLCYYSCLIVSWFPVIRAVYAPFVFLGFLCHVSSWTSRTHRFLVSTVYSRYASFFIHCAGFKNMSAVQDNPANRPLHEIHFIKMTQRLERGDV